MSLPSPKNTNEEPVRVHQRPPAGMIQPFHKSYGLWIFAGCAGSMSPPAKPEQRLWRYFEFYGISHMYAGRGKLLLRDTNQEWDILPGDCVIVTPGTVHWYGGCGGNYCEDTLNFFGPAADMLMKSGIIANGLVHAGTVRRLTKIQELIREPALDSQIRGNLELQNFLVDLHLEKRLNRAEYPRFDALLKEITGHMDQWWTVREMAELCSLSDDQLRRVFRKYTGGTPKQYVDRLKLNRAGELLTTSNLKIAEIAETLGYLDSYHFSRRFKEIMGVSPLRYRENSAIRS